MKSFHQTVIETLEKAQKEAGSINQLADKCGVNRTTLSRWIAGTRSPSVIELGKIFDALGISLDGLSPDPSKDVCFVDATLVPAGKGQRPPEVDDYLAVPLVDEVGAGPGYIPQGVMKSWFLVWKHQSAIAYKRDLIAVQIGKHSTSMLPTLSPEDIVLVDRQDKDISRSGHIMLVMDPDGAGMIKRVAVERQEKKKDFRITYYSDNTAANPPNVYSLREDFFNDWERAIVGRVVWAWSDVHNK